MSSLLAWPEGKDQGLSLPVPYITEGGPGHQLLVSKLSLSGSEACTIFFQGVWAEQW